ncbi:MAG: DNA adenine methylase [Treponema sp.]|jgi:DNA adenine methylase|nr:DNA adenine methylase [Treponema sp.]
MRIAHEPKQTPKICRLSPDPPPEAAINPVYSILRRLCRKMSQKRLTTLSPYATILAGRFTLVYTLGGIMQTGQKGLSPILKWPGGKKKELKYIIPNLPASIHKYYEPFVGGGAVYTAISSAKEYFINDKSNELISLYQSISDKNRSLFFKSIEEIIHNWNILNAVIRKNAVFFIKTYKNFSKEKTNEEKTKNKLLAFIFDNSKQFNGMFSDNFNFNTSNFLTELQTNLFRKIIRMKQIEQKKKQLPDEDILDNMETALKSAFYMHFRHIYNHVGEYNIDNFTKSAIFFFIRNYAYGGMFRYNSLGQFNAPYGGIQYNKNNLQKKVNYLKSDSLYHTLKNTIIDNLDFEDFFKKYKPAKNDFIFLDPPYDTEFSTYTKNTFGQSDQKRLSEFLTNKCRAYWMLIIKNTDFIKQLYFNKGLEIKSFNKTYLVSFMNRNNKDAEHLLITNYNNGALYGK